MPKSNKTHKGLRKRLRKTGTGKVMRGAQGRRHLAAAKSPKRRRQLRKERALDSTDLGRIERQYGKL